MDGTSARTPARVPGARPHRPPCRSRSGFPTRAPRRLPSGSPPGASRRVDSSHPAGRRPARASGRPLLNSSPTVCPSGPGAPLFDTTFNSAAVKRLTTSSIVTGVTFSTLTIASGTPAFASPDRSTDARRAAPFGFSAVAIGRRSCPAVCSTGIAFPCPPGLDPARSAGITPPSSSTRSSDFCRAISLRSFILGHTGLTAGTRQISWGKTLRFRRDHVANTLLGTDRNRASLLAASSPTRRTPYGASLSFATTTHLWLPSDPPSRKPPQRQPGRTGDRPVNSGPRPCLVDVGFPLSGPQDRTPTSDLKRHAQHTAPPRPTGSPSLRSPHAA